MLAAEHLSVVDDSAVAVVVAAEDTVGLVAELILSRDLRAPLAALRTDTHDVAFQSRVVAELGVFLDTVVMPFLTRFTPARSDGSAASFQSLVTDCTAHYIREKVLDSIVLRYLRQVVSYARDKSDEFYAMAMANGEAEAKKQFKDNEKLRPEYETKIAQLDNAIQLLYLDRSNGKITDERYDVLSANFEKEHSELKAKLITLDTQLDEMKVREKRVRDFINNAKQYTEIHKLTPEILKSFIGRIEVYEKAVKHSRTCGNRIVIYLTVVPDKPIMVDRTETESGEMLIKNI